jgi:hypothetical protein
VIATSDVLLHNVNFFDLFVCARSEVLELLVSHYAIVLDQLFLNEFAKRKNFD